MSAKYALGIDVAMLVISALLVFSVASNSKIYDSANTFKRDNDKLRKSGLLLGMTAESVNTLNIVLSILGSAAVGAYGLSVVYKTSRGASAVKGPGVYTAVFGFAVSVGLVLSAMMSSGLYKEVDTYKSDKQKKQAKMHRDLSYAFIAFGSAAFLAVLVKVAMKKKGRFDLNRLRQPFRRPAALSGGSNGVSTFFTY